MNDSPKFSEGPQDPDVQKKEFDRLVQGLEKYATSIEPVEREFGKYKITFQFDEATTRVWILLGDYTGSDVVIINMTTLPDDKTSKGFGKQAIDVIKKWAEENNFNEIRATQVSNPNSERFWVDKNGFVRDEGENKKTKDFLFRLK